MRERADVGGEDKFRRQLVWRQCLALFVGVSPLDAWLKERWRKRLSSSSATTTTDIARDENSSQNTLKLQAYGDICSSASRAEDDLIFCRIAH